MKRVTGIGGIFFKATDPDKLRDWYRMHLGIECEKDSGAIFKWRKADDPNSERYTVWSRALGTKTVAAAVSAAKKSGSAAATSRA